MQFKHGTQTVCLLNECRFGAMRSAFRSVRKCRNAIPSFKQVAQLCRETARRMLKWVTFRLNFRLKLRIAFRANIYGPLNGGMVVLQLCRWKFSHKEALHLQQTLFD